MIAQSGVIFDSSSLQPHHHPKIVLSFLRGAGIGLVMVSIAGVVLLLTPILLVEMNYKFAQKQNPSKPISAFGTLIAREQPAQDLAQKFSVTDTYFSIYIPKINARARVLSNVSASNKKEYLEALKNGVAHAQGSSLPGMAGGTFLFAHSTDSPLNFAAYNAVFYLLHTLDPSTGSGSGDEIYIFRLNKVYKYRVTQKHIVEGSDVSWLKDSKSGEERLILQTCWPPGTTWKRLVIVAKPVGV